MASHRKQALLWRIDDDDPLRGDRGGHVRDTLVSLSADRIQPGDYVPDPLIVDLFAGPGGLDVAAGWLGVPTIGIELDSDACATRKAAGLATVSGDVKAFRPADFPEARVLAGGPPCQTYTVAGGRDGGAGRRALKQVLDLASLMAEGKNNKRKRARVDAELAELAKAPGDKGRTGLVLEPLRWALTALREERPYKAIVLEQVTTVMPVWEAYAEILEGEGYSVDTGVLRTEEYGVPQTRKRAVLIARYHGSATLPEKTHRPFRKKLTPMEEGRRPYVTMVDVLDRLAPFEVISNYGTGGDPKARGRRQHDEPAFTVTGKIRRNKVGPPGHPDCDPRFDDAEAGQLQSFPKDYPWRGKDIPQQIGNAIPPLLGIHILAAALGLGNEARDTAVKKAIACGAAAPESAPLPAGHLSNGVEVQGLFPVQVASLVEQPA
ncbi:DNA cytosine methyltransferase [Streptomyces niveiscabiei]|uniref:DNA (cytosine-5-)-methyltransferase n=1 Tax=Streptomyces niveiscabiei TaxID=164115 RepID=A0ABW9HVX1_9ACTN